MGEELLPAILACGRSSIRASFAKLTKHSKDLKDDIDMVRSMEALHSGTGY
jgi:hypothetical protein